AAVAFEGSEDGRVPNRVELSRTGVDGVFDPATFVTPPGQDTKGPGLAWAAGSAIQLAWQGSADNYDDAVTAVVPADGPLGVPEQDTYEPVGSGVGVQVLGSAGGALSFFQRTDGGMRSVLWNPPSPAAQEPEAVVSPEPADWEGPSVAGDDAGDAVATWSPRATAWLPAVAVWDVTAPAVTVTTPDTVTAGQPFTLKVGATDALSGVASRAVTFSNAFGAPMAGPLLDADGSATVTFSQPGTYTLTAGATDNDGNGGTAARTITAVAPARAPVVVTARCRVPSLRNHSVAYAKRLLTVWRCRLGRVTTPKRYKHVRGLVIRAQSRPAGQKPIVGAHVNVTLGVKPKPKDHAKQRVARRRH
ncbi:MAG: Ig-like domain repeat protein, partial [Conexibacter sp.]|nr:Ig-like domain repeat protein [Conexibacter sp.]